MTFQPPKLLLVNKLLMIFKLDTGLFYICNRVWRARGGRASEAHASPTPFTALNRLIVS